MTRALIKIDGKGNQIWNSMLTAKIYFNQQKSKSKGTGTLMALYKENDKGKWVMVKHN